MKYSSSYLPDLPLALIAGGGVLPQHILQARKSAGQETFLLAIEGCTPTSLTELAPHAWVRIAAVGEAMEQLRRWGTKQIVMAGTIKRPPLRDLLPDAVGRELLKRLGGSLFSGDDKLLRSIVAFFEERGFTVVGAHEVCDELLAQKGTMTRAKADKISKKDIDLGIDVLRVLSPYDMGQAVIVHHGQVLGVEGREGTAALISRCSALKESAGGVLVKMCKVGQERRADMPAVGVETMMALAIGGYAGLCIGAGSTLMLGREAMIDAANQAGLFIEGIDVP
jgi:UDP-2,3-diacylglucosamine hydrolase